MDEKDIAIKHKKDDLLNREKFAKKLADRIFDYDDNEPLNIGIIGKWGFGKTSLINLICCYLEHKLEKEECKKEYIFINFNPWFFSKQSNLYIQFFKVLIEEITNHEYEKIPLFDRTTTPRKSIFKKLRIESLEEYINYIQFNQILPINDFTYSLNSNQMESYQSLLAHKKLCDNFFNSSNYKVIVVIDDMDRLVDKEIKQVITLVKSLADFKNFIYILSFDKNIVAKSLDEIQSDKGDKFLDKIVQIPIILPEITDNIMGELIFEKLKELYVQHSNNYINKNGDLREILYYLKLFIKDLRDLKRYLNVLEFYLDSYDDELNVNDCFVLIALQLFEYNIYSILVDFEEILTSPEQKFRNETRNKKLLADFKDYVNNNLINMNEKNLNKILSYLFPEYGGANVSSYELTKNNRIGSSHHFYKYFSFSLKPTDVSATVLEQLIKSNNENEIFKLLTKNKNRDYNHSLLYLLYLNDSNIPNENIEIFVKGLIKSADNMFIYHSDWKHVDRILRDLLNRIKNHDLAYEILKESDFEKNLFTLLEFVYGVCFYYKKHTGENLKEYESEMPISLKHMENLKDLLIESINESLNNKSLISHPRLKTILVYWKHFETEEIVKKNIKNNVKTDDEILEFINHFQITNYYINSYAQVTKENIHFNFEELEKYIDLKDMITQITTISVNENVSEEIRMFCLLIIKQYEEHINSPNN